MRRVIAQQPGAHMIDETKLAALRARFVNGRPDDVQDPDFRKATALVFHDGDRRTPPYSGISTFLNAPYRPDAPDLPDFGGLQVALIGVPMDLGVTNRSGSRLGPRAMRQVERIGPYNHALRVTPIAECRVADIGDIPFRSRYSLPDSIADIEAFIGRVQAAGVIPLSIGGDHSISYPILRALGRDRPVGLVHIDAHCDTSGELEGSRFHHGGPFRQAVLDGVLDPERSIQIGIRGSAEMLYEFSYVSGMTVLHAEDVDAIGIEAVIDRARAVVGDLPFYVSFDVDGIDPAFTPGTGTPEVGGLTPREAQRILRGLAGLDIIGGDVVEVAPQYDATTVTAQVGAQMAFEILSLMTLRLR
jgi:agmatinase